MSRPAYATGACVKVVEITYRYDGTGASARARPEDADAAMRRLDEGSQAIGALLDDTGEGTDIARRIIPLDPGDLGVISMAVVQRTERGG